MSGHAQYGHGRVVVVVVVCVAVSCASTSLSGTRASSHGACHWPRRIVQQVLQRDLHIAICAHGRHVRSLSCRLSSVLVVACGGGGG